MLLFENARFSRVEINSLFTRCKFPLCARCSLGSEPIDVCVNLLFGKYLSDQIKNQTLQHCDEAWYPAWSMLHNSWFFQNISSIQTMFSFLILNYRLNPEKYSLSQRSLLRLNKIDFIYPRVLFWQLSVSEFEDKSRSSHNVCINRLKFGQLTKNLIWQKRKIHSAQVKVYIIPTVEIYILIN